MQRIVRAQLESSRQIKVLGKNLLELTQIVESNISREVSPSPEAADSGSSLASFVPVPEGISLHALFIEGNYMEEWASLSKRLFQMGISQATAPADARAIALAGSDLCRFDLVFLPAKLDASKVFDIEMHIHRHNYHAIFIGVRNPGTRLPTYDPGFTEIIGADESLASLYELITHHFQGPVYTLHHFETMH